MTNKKEIYRCEICGNIIEVLNEGAGELVCCGQPMILENEKTQDPDKGEKHIPIVEQTEDKIIVNVGEVEHPMTEEHYIEWIEIQTDQSIFKKILKPGDKPIFECRQKKSIKKVRIYCNLHGVWAKEL